MGQYDSEHSSFDKNLRSLLDAVAMFEREAGLVMDRFGLDSDAIGRVMDLVGSLSAEAVRPLAAALGIADKAAVESLARDVRTLLQSEARIRREQGVSAARLDDLLAAVGDLGATTARLADLQARTQDRLDALAERATAIEDTEAQRQRLAAELDRLTARIDALETMLATENDLILAVDDGEESPAPAVRPGVRRQAPRVVKTASTSQKILEGLPTLEPKVRPA